MSNNRIKVVGYAQKVVYNGSIEYRNFTPDLVGVQLASNGNTPMFTMGNFSITTNLDSKFTKNFKTNNFSNFITLDSLDLTLQKTLNLLTNNAGVILNLDKKNLTNYALFNSLTEYTRVALENIITNFPAALYINPYYVAPPTYESKTGLTFENYVYNSVTNKSFFKISTNVINNKFQINYQANGTLQGTYNTTNNLRNLSTSYLGYSVLNNGTDFDIIGFTGSTNPTNDYVYFETVGDVFSGTSSGYSIYYIKPNKVNENLFYNTLPDFEYYLLNRLSTPIYTSEFNFTVKSTAGNVIYANEKITWPVSDGYNIDFDTDAYTLYANKLLNITNNFDSTTSNLMVRFLVTDSITDFDTTDTHVSPDDQDTSGQKMNKTLTIYGVELDKINAFIQGIKFANTVSYDKNNNMPDIYLKNLARVLGWELISSVVENDLLKNYIDPKPSTYAGQSVGLTLVEADVELWRRIILNTPWLWKSKGSRKAVEFLFKFIGTPLGLIKFNEYIYLAENKVDTNLLQEVLQLNNLSTDLTKYPIDSDGYPNPLPNTPNMYFQNYGLWFRETGGANSTIDKNTGNNPHVGPYDGGSKYINQFGTLIPDFSAVTVSSQTVTTTTSNLFSNYKMGTFAGNTNQLFVDITDDNGVDFSNAYVVTNSVIPDPKARLNTTNNDCIIPDELYSLEVKIKQNQQSTHQCTSKLTVNSEMNSRYGFINYQISLPNLNSVLETKVTTMFIDKTCCKAIGEVPYIPYFYNQVNGTSAPFTLKNSGYICCKTNSSCGCYVTCKWILDTSIYTNINGDKYLVFIDEMGVRKVVSQDGCHCPTSFTTAINITDPTTNETGVGCRLDISPTSGDMGQLIKTFVDRASGVLNCDEQYYGL